MQREPKDWLLVAYNAATKSPDLSTQNGAIIVAQDNIVLQACNEFPRNVKMKAERMERPLKYSFTEHAERGAVFQAAKYGVSVQGCTMYACWAACDDCARAIIQSGIAKVVTHKDTMDMTPEHWKDSIKIAFEMFEESGVVVEFISGKIGAPPIRFNGKIVSF